MKCYYHPTVEAVTTCSNCGRAICGTDLVNVGGRPICKQCLAGGQVSTPPVAVPSNPTNILAIISLVVGIVALVTCWCSPVIGMVFGAGAAITGYLARKEIGRGPQDQQNMQLATIGMWLGIVEAALGLLLLLVVFGLLGVGTLAEFLDQILQQR